jgi:hypothetical protein
MIESPEKMGDKPIRQKPKRTTLSPSTRRLRRQLATNMSEFVAKSKLLQQDHVIMNVSMSGMAKADELNIPIECLHNSRVQATQNSNSEQVYQIGPTLARQSNADGGGPPAAMMLV